MSDTLKAYAVTDWDRFENAQSRRVAKLSWIAISNSHDTGGFRRVMAMPNGIALYGAWVLIVEVASKMPTRGVLATNGGPLDADDLAVRTGAPADVFELALKVLSEPKIGWLHVITLDARSTLGADSEQDHSCYEQKGREGKGTEGPDPEGNGTEKKGTEPKEVESRIGSGFSSDERIGSDRINKVEANDFCLTILSALGISLDAPDAIRNRRPLLAVHRRVIAMSSPRNVFESMVSVAKDKLGMDNPAAAWQKEIDKRWPPGGKAKG